jgi:putative flavoprotein involved in K+ transport
MAITDTIVIGAGQAGLAMSRSLTDRGVDHVVLERGRLAERWRTERWDSLRLLTPNWMSRLPGWAYDGPDPDGFMAAGEVVTFFERYADSFAAPIRAESAVRSLRRDGDGYQIATTDATWRAANVVIATGWCDQPAVPAMGARLPAGVRQLVPSRYRRPEQLPAGGVLVVGASATGVQLAHELRVAGRDVVLAVGRHSRLARHYRGMDIFWWLERIGSLDRTIDEMPEPRRARNEPSLQLVGRADRATVDLARLQRAGVELTGRVAGIDGRHVSFARDLTATTDAAESRLQRVLATIDRHIETAGLGAELLDAEPMTPLLPTVAPDQLDLRGRGIGTVLWATGYRRSYPWLHVPVLDVTGEIRHRRGVTPVPGLYVLGQRFQHTRRSNFIDGVGRDATFIAEHLTCSAPLTTPC